MPRQGQWVKTRLPDQVILADGTAPHVNSLPQLHASNDGLIVGVWYPPGKLFFEFRTGCPCASFWPVDPVDGMPVSYGGQRLTLNASSLDLRECDFADVPPARTHAMKDWHKRQFIGEHAVNG